MRDSLPRDHSPFQHPHCHERSGKIRRIGLVAMCCAILFGCAGTDVSGPFSAAMAFYRGPLNHLAGVRHGQCPMIPSCSEYAAQAVAVHGEFIGWIMVCDRLMRCGRDELRYAPRQWDGDDLTFHDPLSANDFWWDSATIPPEFPNPPP